MAKRFLCRRSGITGDRSESAPRVQPNDEELGARFDLSPEEVSELRAAFCMFDKNGDGRITDCELGSVMEALGQNPTQEELKAMVMEVDADRSGTIEFDEFVEMMSRKVSERDNELEMMQAFTVFDRDGDGYITAGELHHVMHSLGERLTHEEVDDMIKAADLNGDGKINYHEFTKMMIHKQL